MLKGLNSTFLRNAIDRSAENQLDRRRFLRAAGMTGAGVAAIGAVGLGAGTAMATDDSDGEWGDGEGDSWGDGGTVSDGAVLNFALNLEYLEAEFYLRAVTGEGLGDDMIDGSGALGAVTGGRKVKFETKLGKQYAQEIAADERAHVAFLRAALGDAKVARPEINIQEAFTAAATAAGVIKAGETFDPYADENSFLLGAFVFEDVGVTAYKGASPLISNKTYLEAAAGILAVEAYHAGLIRTVLLAKGLADPANKISDARDSLDGPTDLDQGITNADGSANVVPTDGDGIAFSRTTGQVLNVVYLNPASTTSGGFFPNGVNGNINTSDDNS